MAERGGQVLPIHDLYWNWLAGRGLLAEPVASATIDDLQTRESYRLALQSGALPAPTDIAAAAHDDLVLAGMFDAGLRARSPDADFDAGVTRTLSDGHLAVRNRGGLAALESGRSGYLARALSVLSELTSAKLYVADWAQALQPKSLFPQRATLADWIGSEGTVFVLDAIAERGGPEWTPWLEQIASAGKVAPVDALAAALGCAGDIPDWGGPHLDDLFSAKSWKLRTAASRRANTALARHIAAQYERLVETVIKQNSSAWVDLNRVLVACGDDAVFESLLSRFGSMGARSQELLGFAVVERGQPWIAAFQKIAFAKAGGRQHHKLAEVLSPDVDDAMARAWIKAGWYEVGWRVLIARHGEAVLPELIAQLPASFADLHDIPALAVMRFFNNAPASLPNDLLSRLGSPMQPKAMQDVLNAIARVYPTGLPTIVQFVSQQPDALPAYHIAQALRLHEAWRGRFGGQLSVNLPTGESRPFSHWIAMLCARRRWENHFTAEMLALSPDLAIGFVLAEFKDDVEKAAAVLRALKDVRILQCRIARPHVGGSEAR